MGMILCWLASIMVYGRLVGRVPLGLSGGASRPQPRRRRNFSATCAQSPHIFGRFPEPFFHHHTPNPLSSPYCPSVSKSMFQYLRAAHVPGGQPHNPPAFSPEQPLFSEPTFNVYPYTHDCVCALHFGRNKKFCHIVPPNLSIIALV